MAGVTLGSTFIALGELNQRFDDWVVKKQEPQYLKVNKHYFRLYQIGFMVVETLMLITLMYLLLYRPFVAHKE
jgi:hypothetical protein